ncbi:hypothetical protein CSTERTH_00995 [Thermoclostridium stercorarium subsp. thermolacticum DSM 2910]|uniref:Uncharacterized protein n=1 Tax=Thermoclostridium stercorarium subsp. thermolacticum DSM 2910 TaxID=1121336 RepID=A0A1B1YAC3_THEST|nr:hypothetical protein [Thermoclostridium stercorarium]ANW97706.1 hypothetical protein CSTERTH_00995 [Thermoclostridium stercorarium subsp. thermolacticum DSM 2910]
MSRSWDDKLKKITYDYITIESEEFYGVAYAVLQGEMSIVTQRNGRLDLSVDSIPALCQELMDIYETYKDNNNIMSGFYDKTKNAALKG